VAPVPTAVSLSVTSLVETGGTGRKVFNETPVVGRKVAAKRPAVRKAK